MCARPEDIVIEETIEAGKYQECCHRLTDIWVNRGEIAALNALVGNYKLV